MTIIQDTCDSCGKVKMAVHDVYIEVRGQDVFYHFTCPDCRTEHERPASVRIHAVLIASGVGTVGDAFAQRLDHNPYVPEEWL